MPPAPPREAALQQLFAPHAVPDHLRRRQYTLNDVPASADGLKILAACGNWAAVQLLASQLEQAHYRTSNMEAYLQFALAHVTALLQMQQYTAANELLERLGDLDAEKYRSPTSDESLVPFSLRFLHSTVPRFTGKVEVAYSRLSALLEKVKAIRDNASAPPSPEQRDIQSHRWRRLNRALAVLCFDRGDAALGIHHLSELAQSARESPIEKMMFLQQLGCAFLRIGDLNTAQATFKQVTEELLDEYDDDAIPAKTEDIFGVITSMNSAFVDMFCGRANDALKKLHDIAAPMLAASLPSSSGTTSAAAPTEVNSAEIHADNARVYRAGSIPVLLLVKLLAVNTYIVCHQYAASSERCSVPNSIASFEALLRRYPVAALRIQPIGLSIKRLYEWQGGTSINRQAFLESLVDYFVVGKEAMPYYLR